ncbi:MAG: hypothetical protein IJ035_03295 [Oscillospiraceae bacterium]|nr:hypothetical protein [Oscillospiraceae bacterium]
MIKGVNRRIVEITSTEHEFFEKAVLYVKADKSNTPTEKINEEAREYLDRIIPVKKAAVSVGNKLLIGMIAVLIVLVVTLIIVL